MHGFAKILISSHVKKAIKVKPFLDGELRGLFATRAPARPNPVGISVVRLVGIDDAVLYIKDIDVVDETPLLDIKPYVPGFDIREVDKTGWIGEKAKKVKKTQDDGRFAK